VTYPADKYPDWLFSKIIGIIHIGANTGQEREIYAKYNLDVLWIEPILEVYKVLQLNLQKFPKEIAINALITDVDDKEYAFHIANNIGMSSSIFELEMHKDIWPKVKYIKTITLISKTLPSVLTEQNLNKGKYNMLILDTQGSEMLVLKRSTTILSQFKYLQVEVCDFESYKGCCTLKELELFLQQYHFKEIFRKRTATHPRGGQYFDIVYRNNNL